MVRVRLKAMHNFVFSIMFNQTMKKNHVRDQIIMTIYARDLKEEALMAIMLKVLTKKL